MALEKNSALSMGRVGNVGTHSFAVGDNVYAEGESSHAEGYNTDASGDFSHAEGVSTIASEKTSHAEGMLSEAKAEAAHAEGTNTIASGESSHAEGSYTTASGIASHAEGKKNKATNNFAHAEGSFNTASGNSSHAEGFTTEASGMYSHAEGEVTLAKGTGSHAEGFETIAKGNYSHVEGTTTEASGEGSHAEGYQTRAIGDYSHAEGSYSATKQKYITITGNANATTYTYLESDITLGINNIIYYNNNYSTIKSRDSSSRTITVDKTLSATSISNVSARIYSGGISYGDYSHSEGEYSIAIGNGSHAEGGNTKAIGDYSHAEGYASTSNGLHSHSEGYNSHSTGDHSHSEGHSSYSRGENSHAEGGDTEAIGFNSHAEGYNTIARGECQHVQGKYNIEDTENKYAHIVGNGDSTARSNAHTLDWDGNAWFAGDVFVGGTGQDDENTKQLVTDDELATKLNINQGVDNARNHLIVNDSGDIEPYQTPTFDLVSIGLPTAYLDLGYEYYNENSDEFKAQLNKIIEALQKGDVRFKVSFADEDGNKQDVHILAKYPQEVDSNSDYCYTGVFVYNIVLGDNDGHICREVRWYLGFNSFLHMIFIELRTLPHIEHTHRLEDITDLKRLDAMNLTTAQTAKGVKTFSDGINIGNASLTYDSTNKRLVISVV